MITRSLLTLFTALLLGATLSAPMAMALGEKYEATQSFTVTSGEWLALPIQPSDTEADEGLTSLLLVPVPPVQRVSVSALPLQPDVARSSERPPARASPTCL